VRVAVAVCNAVPSRQSGSCREVFSPLHSFPLISFTYLGDTIQSRERSMRLVFAASSEGEEGI
jgi:hypothetical protein